MTGFVDGEGSFTYSRSAKQIALYFAIKLSAIDHSVLEAIRSFFGVGKIYSSPRTEATKSYYRVTHRDDLQRIVEHFDAYPLRSSKRHVYEIWRHMVQIKLQFRKPDRDALNTLAAMLSARVRNQS